MLGMRMHCQHPWHSRETLTGRLADSSPWDGPIEEGNPMREGRRRGSSQVPSAFLPLQASISFSSIQARNGLPFTCHDT